MLKSKVLRYCLIFLSCASILMLVIAFIELIFNDSPLSLSLVIPAITVLLAANAIWALERHEKNKTNNSD
jgi:hypothetical protein